MLEYKIEKISNIKNKENCLKKIGVFLQDLILEYPLHDMWFKEVSKQLLYNYTNGEREILFVQDNNEVIIAVAILKKTEFEKKICTLRVADNFQKKGIGSNLVKQSCEFLETDKPIITVSQAKLGEFIHLFNNFGFVLRKEYYGKYKELSTEYCFNGILLPESILINEDNTKQRLTTSIA